MSEAFFILEDDTNLHDFYRAFFRERELYIFDELNTAIDFINSDDFNKVILAILDVNINSTLKIGGFNAAYQILKVRPQLPIVICSAYKKDNYVYNYSKMIGATIFEKPFELESLIQKINDILGNDAQMPISELDNLYKAFMSSVIHFKLNMLMEYSLDESSEEILSGVDKIEQELMENYNYMIDECNGLEQTLIIEKRYNFFKTFQNELVDYVNSLLQIVQRTIMSMINLSEEEELFVDEMNEIGNELLKELDKL